MDLIFDRLLKKFKRREWVANPADPTNVTEYKRGRLRIITSWGVELQWKGKRISYDGRFGKWLYDGLENAYIRRMGNDEDYDRAARYR